MSPCYSILRQDMKRNVTGPAIWVLIGLTLMAMVIAQIEIRKYQAGISEQAEFLRIEKDRISHYSNNDIYVLFGFRILSIPAPFAVLGNSSSGTMVGIIDSGIGLKVIKPQMGGNTFEKANGDILDLSWFLLFIGSFSLAWGFFTFGPKNRDYLKFLANFAAIRTVFTGMILSRVILLIAWSLATVAILYVQLLLNNIYLGTGGLGLMAAFVLVLNITLIFIFLTGSILGALKNRVRGGVLAVFFWLVLILLWPLFFNSLFFEKSIAGCRSVFSGEAQKMRLMDDFERKVFEKIKVISNAAERRQLMKELDEYFLKNEFPRIEKIDDEMIAKTKDLAKKYHIWSIFCPVTFYRSAGNEISSLGFNGYLGFCEEIKKKQRGFREYIHRKRFVENDPVVKPYLKDDEYIYRMKSSLPGYFGLGVAVNLLYILLAFFFSYVFFKRSILPVPKEAGVFENIDLKLDKGGIFAYGYLESSFRGYMYSFLKGRPGVNIKLSIDGKSLSPGQGIEFLYLPDTHTLPQDIKIGEIVRFFSGAAGIPGSDVEKIKLKLGAEMLEKPFANLGILERLEILTGLVENATHPVFLLDDFSRGLGTDVGIPIMKRLKGKNRVVIELFPNSDVRHNVINSFSLISYENSRYKENEIREKQSVKAR